jgi:hypothetical protein
MHRLYANTVPCYIGDWSIPEVGILGSPRTNSLWKVRGQPDAGGSHL